ncbi:hypothetical protein ABFX02_10G112200 [Erythranthe guttata]
MVMRKDLATGMNARTIGSGKGTIVLAHGYGGDQSIWDKIVPELAGSHRVLVFDWCFSGAVKDPTLYEPAKYGSYDGFADDLISLIDELLINKVDESSSSSSSSVYYVGHSMSAMIGCIASLKRPNLFQGLILVGASPRFINSEDYEGGFEMSNIEQLFSSIESNFEEWATNFASLVVDSSDPLSINKFEKCLKKMRQEVALSLAKTVFLSDCRDILDKVVVPCHIIQTRNDAVVPSSVPKYIQSKIMNGKCHVDIIDTDGHFPQLTAHTQFLEVLSRILVS